MYAHLTKTRDGYELTISTTPDLSGKLSTVSIWRVAGKRQARTIAKQHNAQPWNF